MPENYKLVRWVAVTSKGNYILSEKEMHALMQAEQSGSRFVAFEDFVLNVAFVQEIYKKTETRDPEFYPLSKADKKYLEGKPCRNLQT